MVQVCIENSCNLLCVVYDDNKIKNIERRGQSLPKKDIMKFATECSLNPKRRTKINQSVAEELRLNPH